MLWKLKISLWVLVGEKKKGPKESLNMEMLNRITDNNNNGESSLFAYLEDHYTQLLGGLPSVQFTQV